MDKYFFKGFKNTIGYLVFKKIIVFYIIFASVIASYQIYSELSSASKNIEKDFYSVYKHYKKLISYSMWFYEPDNINDLVNTMREEREEISGVAILNSKNEIINLNGVVDPKFEEYKPFKELISKYNFAVSPVIGFEFDIYNEIEKGDKKIGEIHFFITQKTVFDYTKESIFLILFNIFVSIIAFWILTVYATNKFLSIPLKKLIDGIKDFEENEEEKVAINLDLKNLKELTILADSFNKMSGKISEDIINLRQLTMIQNQQKKALVEANKTKDDFLANMSHELKTPLNSINLISSIMMKNKNNRFEEKDLKNLKIINSCGSDLLLLINDILDLSKLEAGELKLNYSSMDIKPFLSNIADIFHYQLKEKNLSLEINCSEDVEKIYTDEQRLGQIIKNLLSNAIKFTEKGTIKINLENSDNDLKISIGDEGIGIKQEKLTHIFDRFKQADGSTTRKHGGTGLGLAICKDLVNLFNGKIEIQSEVDIGTTITFLIPKNLDKIDGKENVETRNETSLEKMDHDFLFEEFSIEKEKESKVSEILVLNSDPISYMTLIIELNKNFKIHQTNSFEDLEKRLNEKEFDLVLVDYDSLEKNNLEKVLNIKTKTILASKENDKIDANTKEQVQGILSKPFNNENVINKIKEALN